MRGKYHERLAIYNLGPSSKVILADCAGLLQNNSETKLLFAFRVNCTVYARS